MIKKILIVFCVFLISVCCACRDPDLFPPELTKWSNEDGTIQFIAVTSERSIGTMVINGEKIKFFIIFDYTFEMYLYPIEQYYYDESLYQDIEEWSHARKDGKIIATVVKSTYFQVGQEIIFNLVEENVDEDEIPYPQKPESLPEPPDYDFPYSENSNDLHDNSSEERKCNMIPIVLKKRLN